MQQFEYKVDDKIRCKKFFKCEHSTIIFYNGSEYYIEDILETYDSIIPRFIIVNTKCNLNKGFYFNMKDFEEVFYSKSEIRKLKLNKIKKIF